MVYKLRKGLAENGILRYDKEYADAAKVSYLLQVEDKDACEEKKRIPKRGKGSRDMCRLVSD